MAPPALPLPPISNALRMLVEWTFLMSAPQCRTTPQLAAPHLLTAYLLVDSTFMKDMANVVYLVVDHIHGITLLSAIQPLRIPAQSVVCDSTERFGVTAATKQ